MATPGDAPSKGLTTSQWRRVHELFDGALEVAVDERTLWLESAARSDGPEILAEVQSLLASHEEASEEFVLKRVGQAAASLARENQPARAGPYRLVRELGQGGMGAVYLAERDDDEYKTNVAIKLVRGGLDTDLILNRFYRERQTLARLQHPNIARLLDGGTTSGGLPYIVMEFVEGSRITDYCREQNAGIAQRLTLFLDVCKAVDYAHRQFVVHRDLKPGNILVDQSGAVKLLDFGICKLLHSQTQYDDQTIEAGATPLTPDYASPEQIRGDPINVASDVYSAAAVLYELLTDARPHRIDSYTLHGIERGICEKDIVRPSLATTDKSVSRQLQGDLDNILMFALQKDPERRYPSMEQFAADIRRHLNHEPVTARPDTVTYRTRKFLRRRRGFVAAAAAVVLAISAGVFSSVRSARIANENLRLVRQLSNTFVVDIYDAVRDLPGATNARHLIVKTGLHYLDNLSRSSEGDIDFQRELASAYRRIGEVQGHALGANLGNTAEALVSYEKGQKLLNAALQRDPANRLATLELIALLLQIGALESYTKGPSKALKTYDQAKNAAEAYLARAPHDDDVSTQLAWVYNAAGLVKRRSGDHDGARRDYLRAIEILKPLEKAYPDDRKLQRSIAQTYSGLALGERQLGRFKESLEGHRQNATRLERLASLDPANASYQRDLMFTYAHIGDLLGNPYNPNLGDMPGAAEAYGRMMSVARRLHENDAADHRAKSDYGIALARMGAVLPAAKVDDRIAVFRQSIQLLQEVVKMNPENVVDKGELVAVHNFLGDAYLSAGKVENAMQTFREGLNGAAPLLAAGSGTVLTNSLHMCRKLGESMARRGNREESLSLARQALGIAEPGPNSQRRSAQLQRSLQARGYAAAGLIYAALSKSAGAKPSDRAEARSWLRQSADLFRELEKLPTFFESQRREFRAVQSALESLR